MKCGNGSGACLSLAVDLGSKYFFIANLGDCAAILIQKDGFQELNTKTHYPTNVEEHKRITGAGFHVVFGRVNGEINVSRALGDFELKRYDNNGELDEERDAVSCIPYVLKVQKNDSHLGLLLMSELGWEILTRKTHLHAHTHTHTTRKKNTRAFLI